LERSAAAQLSLRAFWRACTQFDVCSKHMTKDLTMMAMNFCRFGIVIFILVTSLVGLKGKLIAAQTSVLKLPFVEKTLFVIGKHFLLTGDPDFSAVGTASAAEVVIDTSHSRQKGWYSEELVYDHETIINGYQAAPVSKDQGQATTDHRYYPAKFEYYDLQIYVKDPETKEFVSSYTWVDSGWFEPDIFLDHALTYVIWATTKYSETKFRVFSNYHMKNGPDDRLREPGDYMVRVKFKVYDLSYTEEEGMVFTPNQERLYREVPGMNAIANDHRQVDVLKKHQWIMEGPNAYGWIKRRWGKESDVVVPADQFATFPAGVPVGSSAIVVREVYKVQEELGRLDDQR
jgi:hypothetical protein